MPFLLGSCVGVRFLEDDQTLLYSQQIEGAEHVDPDRLDNLYRQEPNSRVPVLSWAPYVGIYQAGLRHYDKEALQQERFERKQYWDSLLVAYEDNPRKLARTQRKRSQELNKLDKAIAEGNLRMRWGEPLAVYDPNLAKYTADQMKQYLINRGYLLNETGFRAETTARRTRVTYWVKEGTPYILDSLVIVTRDSAILNMLRQDQDQSLLQLGDNYDSGVLEDERNRIDDVLKDSGYYAFSRNYISYEVDTTSRKNHRVIVRILIRTPEERDAHERYKIDSVIITTDANITSAIPRRREVSDGLVYRYFEQEYATRILNRRIFLSPNSYYSRSNTLATQRQLANLDNFKFINIKYDTVGDRFTAKVYLSPLPKRQISDEVGLVVSQGLPGPLLNVTFTNRNVFGHLENLQTSGRFSIEGVPTNDTTNSIGQSIEASANMSLVFPQFLLPGSETFKRRLGYVNPRTRAQIGYAYNDRPQYRRNTVNANYAYNWDTKKGSRYQLNLWDLSLITSQINNADFQAFLDELASRGNALNRTFEPSVVSNFQVSANYNFLGAETSQNRAAYLRVLLDVGGTIWNFVNDDFLTNEEGLGLETFQYVKVNADFVRYHPAKDGSVLAYRTNFGFAGSYADNQILPFEKYFFAGGSNSIRAWRPRRLGPGSYSQRDSTGAVQFQFDQQGEILLQGSVEWRRNIFDFIDGAVFVDFGNTWTIREDPLRPGSQFAWDRFYNELAIGLGLGVRADFSFLILRVDVGMKAHDPAFPMGERWFPSQYNYANPFSNGNEAYILNLGIGYPF